MLRKGLKGAATVASSAATVRAGLRGNSMGTIARGLKLSARSLSLSESKIMVTMPPEKGSLARRVWDESKSETWPEKRLSEEGIQRRELAKILAAEELEKYTKDCAAELMKTNTELSAAHKDWNKLAKLSVLRVNLLEASTMAEARKIKADADKLVETLIGKSDVNQQLIEDAHQFHRRGAR